MSRLLGSDPRPFSYFREAVISISGNILSLSAGIVCDGVRSQAIAIQSDAVHDAIPVITTV